MNVLLEANEPWDSLTCLKCNKDFLYPRPEKTSRPTECYRCLRQHEREARLLLVEQSIQEWGMPYAKERSEEVALKLGKVALQRMARPL